MSTITFAEALAYSREITQTENRAKRSAENNTNQAPTAKKAAFDESTVNQILPINSSFTMQRNEFFNQSGQAAETIFLPDCFVGFIIGKGGEQISKLQKETGCRIQISPASFGVKERECTLTGSQEAVGTAKRILLDIINRGKGAETGERVERFPQGASVSGHVLVEMFIPGVKAGMIIGKGGETIKRLQEECGVKMTIIQDSSHPTLQDKPLQIQGDRDSVTRAQEKVLELLSQSNFEVISSVTSFSVKQDSYTDTSTVQHRIEISVPSACVGIVIGKGGEVIRKIQEESGARVQFKKEDEPDRPVRLCTLTGPPGKVMAAQRAITKIISDSAVKEGVPGAQEQTQLVVPEDKTGSIIGKGGENIRRIKELTGAHVQLDRNNQPNEREKVFFVRGTVEQMQRAIGMICEKAGIPVPRTSGHGYSAVPARMINSAQHSVLSAHGAGVPGPWAGTPAGPGAFQTQAWNGMLSVGQPQQPQVASFPAQLLQSPQVPGGLSSAQNGQPQNAGQLFQASPVAPQSASSLGAASPATSQPDYSLQWAEYYRQQGLHDVASLILQQSANRQGGGPTPSAPPVASVSAAPQTIGGLGQTQITGVQQTAFAALPAGYPGLTQQPTASQTQPNINFGYFS